MEAQKTLSSQRNLEGAKKKKKKKARGFMLPDFRLYCKVTVIKTICSWHESRVIDQWSRIYRPEKNSHT